MRKKMKPIEEQSLAERLIWAHGWREAYYLMGFIADWCICCEMLKRPPKDVEEYAKWWKISRSQAFRYQARFRVAFPDMQDPTPFWESAHSTYSELFKSKNSVQVAAQLGLAL